MYKVHFKLATQGEEIVADRSFTVGTPHTEIGPGLKKLSISRACHPVRCAPPFFICSKLSAVGNAKLL